MLTTTLAALLAACQFLSLPGESGRATAARSSTSNTSALSGSNAKKPATVSQAAPNKPGRVKTGETPLPGMAPPWLLSQPEAQLQAAPVPPVPARAMADHAPLPASTRDETAAQAVPAPPSIAAPIPPIPAAPGESANPPPGFLLPDGLFGKPPTAKPPSPAPAPTASPPMPTGTQASAIPPNITPSAAPATSAAAATVTPSGSTGLAGATTSAATTLATTASADSTATASAVPAQASASAVTAPARDKLANLRAPVSRAGDDMTRKLVPNKLPPVFIYASPTSRRFFAAGGINYQNNLDTWQLVLRRLDIPFEIIDNLSPIEKNGFKPANSLLILPSAIALSEPERRSLGRYHDQGGALLASWLCGVRNERGEWLGFGFMESVLGTKVVGTTEADNDDSFLIPYGNSPVSHQLPAGFRVWTERVPNWYPLRLASNQLAAQITDWSRGVKHDKRAGLISYEQRAISSGTTRSVVLGFPERLWYSADQKAFDALAGDALFWLLREPAVYLSNWPYPYHSGFILSINASDFTEETDDAFARQTEAAGWHGTYYVLSEHAESGKTLLGKLAQRGHEIGYFGDRLVGFQNQSANQQKKRIDTMFNEMKELEIDTASPPGFRAPMESSDATTLRLLRAKGISHIVTDSGVSESRLPLISPGPVAANGEPLVLLPRTLSGAEDLMADTPPAEAIKNYLTELDLTTDMGALGVVSLPTRSSLSPAQWGEILARLKARDKQIWLSTANQVSSWWREHERVHVSLNTDVSPALLTLQISGEGPLQHAVTLLVNLPQSGRVPLLFANGHDAPAPKVASFDNLRAALILPNLAPGKYEWYLSFTAP